MQSHLRSRLAQLLPQCGPVYAQQACCRDLAVLGNRKCGSQERSFHEAQKQTVKIIDGSLLVRMHVLMDPGLDVGADPIGESQGACSCKAKRGWEVVRPDLTGSGENRCVFDRVAQFADIPVPRMGTELADHFVGQMQIRRAIHNVSEKIFRKKRNAFHPLTQRRNFDMEDTQPIQQVLAKLPRRD